MYKFIITYFPACSHLGSHSLLLIIWKKKVFNGTFNKQKINPLLWRILMEFVQYLSSLYFFISQFIIWDFLEYKATFLVSKEIAICY